MPKSHRIVLWRHGQTDWNINNRFQGHSDIPLNEVGVYQAQRAAQLLAGMKPTGIISSDLQRASATAQALSDLVRLPVEIDKDLRETNGGHWEGKTGEENRENDFANFAFLESFSSYRSHIGEYWADFRMRHGQYFNAIHGVGI